MRAPGPLVLSWARADLLSRLVGVGLRKLQSCSQPLPRSLPQPLWGSRDGSRAGIAEADALPALTGSAAAQNFLSPGIRIPCTLCWTHLWWTCGSHP